MDSHGTHPDIARLLLQYLRGRGRTSCLEYAKDLNLPDIFREYAASQDVIGWDNFIMGMISHKLLDIQSTYFHTAGESYCATRWIAGLITHLLQVTHTQWIYRCVLVHDRNTGVLILAHKEDSLKEIEHQLALGPEGLHEENRFLLECNFNDITSTTGEHQGYWLLGIQAAREAARIPNKNRGEAQCRPQKHQRWA